MLHSDAVAFPPTIAAIGSRSPRVPGPDKWLRKWTDEDHYDDNESQLTKIVNDGLTRLTQWGLCLFCIFLETKWALKPFKSKSELLLLSRYDINLPCSSLVSRAYCTLQWCLQPCGLSLVTLLAPITLQQLRGIHRFWVKGVKNTRGGRVGEKSRKGWESVLGLEGRGGYKNKGRN